MSDTRLKKYINSASWGSGYHPTGQFPLDDRTVVTLKDSLYQIETWRGNEQDESYPTFYEGMVVTVLQDNSLYVLTNQYPAENGLPDVTIHDNWKKIGADLSTIQGKTVEIVSLVKSSNDGVTEDHPYTGGDLAEEGYTWTGASDTKVMWYEVTKKDFDSQPQDVKTIMQIEEHVASEEEGGEDTITYKYYKFADPSITAIYSPIPNKGGEGTYLVLDLSGDGYDSNDVYIKTTELIDITQYYTKNEIDAKFDIVDTSLAIIDTSLTSAFEQLGDRVQSITVNNEGKAITLTATVTDAEYDDDGNLITPKSYTLSADASIRNEYNYNEEYKVDDVTGEIVKTDGSYLVTNNYVKDMMAWTTFDNDDEWANWNKDTTTEPDTETPDESTTETPDEPTTE